ncbi:CBS domain-containing protein [Halostella sp. JP-L12]|uniref:site-2 protease family protein n=1 Tax=Halostella TaxID=1843185 RepID=UPI000EF797F2|nr:MULTISPECIES: site-2 protease family protein [Halostella]NHN47874.1 CBS domain-containing protein [Halostella sp. JP-L12]
MRNFTVARIWGIPIRINVSLLVFLPVLAWLIGSGGQISAYEGFIEGLTGVGFDPGVLEAGSNPWIIGVAAGVGLFVSVLLHELGHSWVALRYGLSIESITLWILGGLAALSEIPREWDREFRIAIAGPITSVLVAGASYAALFATPSSLPVVRFVFGWLAITNVALAVFNMLPAFPMDGGRILRALLARNRPYLSATRIAARIGVVFAVLFAVVGVLAFDVIMLLLAFFIYGAATTESRSVMMDELLDGLAVRDVMSGDQEPISAGSSVADLTGRMFRDRRTVYPVSDGGTVVGVVTLGDLRSVAEGDRESTTVGSVAREVPRVDANADAFEALASFDRSREGHALVEEHGSVVGVLTREDYGRVLALRREVGPAVLTRHAQ